MITRPCAIAIEKYLKSVNKFATAKVATRLNDDGAYEITEWVVDGLDQPSDAAIESIIDDYGNNVVIYDPNVLIAWAMNQIFTQELIPHFAAFLDFANKANSASRDNFIAYATAVSLLDTANTIIDKAIELGASI